MKNKYLKLNNEIISLFGTSERDILYRNKILFDKLPVIIPIKYNELIIYLYLIVELNIMNKSFIIEFVDLNKCIKINNNNEIAIFIIIKTLLGDKSIVEYIKNRFNINLLNEKTYRYLKNIDFDSFKDKLNINICKNVEYIIKETNLCKSYIFLSKKNQIINLLLILFIYGSTFFISIFLSNYINFYVLTVLMTFIYNIIYNLLNKNRILNYLEFNFPYSKFLFNRYKYYDTKYEIFNSDLINLLIPSIAKIALISKFLLRYFIIRETCVLLFFITVLYLIVYMIISFFINDKYFNENNYMKLYSVSAPNNKNVYKKYIEVNLTIIKETWYLIILYIILINYNLSNRVLIMITILSIVNFSMFSRIYKFNKYIIYIVSFFIIFLLLILLF